MFYLIILALIGLIAVAVILIESLWSVFELLSSYLMPYFLPAEVEPLVKRFGPWAAVTGGTDGIGKDYACELAKRGFNLVIISRNPDKLKAVTDELEKQHNVKTKTIIADFSKGQEVYAHIEQELKDIPLGLLVNNVGIQYDELAPLAEVPVDKIWQLINVNVGAVTALTRLVLPAMLQRGRGGIVNVSSGSELMPLPYMTVYAATKAYVKSFTLAVREEYAGKGIYFQHLAPMFVCTKINAFSDDLMTPSLFNPDSATFARHAVSTLGRIHNTTGFWLHSIQTFFINLAPLWMRTKIGKMINLQLLSRQIRKKIQ